MSDSLRIEDRTTIERIASTYLHEANGDPHRALAAAITDAIADLESAERRCADRDKLVSAGYVHRPPRIA